MDQTAETIAPDDRTLATLTHLAGLAGYVIPLGGVLVPIIIWMVKSDSPTISSIAKQAVLLNVVIFLVVCVSVVLLLTVILIPFIVVFWFALAIVAIALPIVGAIKAGQGTYYRYPVIGVSPV